MKRQFKKKEQPKGNIKDYAGIVDSIDKRVSELEENNVELETMLKILKDKDLSDNEKEQLSKAMQAALNLSSTIQKAIGG